METFNPGEFPKFASPEEELIFLRKHVADKEKNLQKESLPINREKIISETIHDYSKVSPERVLPKNRILEEGEAEGIVLNLKPEKHDTVMEELLGILLTGGIKNVLAVLGKMNNPHILDDFHRFLVQYIKSVGDVSGLKKGNPIFKSVHMKLFEITLPDNFLKDVSFREFVSAMEQFYSGMQSVSEDRENYAKNYYTLEIALSSTSDEVVFYSAVPESKKALLEKQILAFFDNAKIREVNDDYNIFSENGFTAGAYGSLEKYEVFPLKTYTDFEHDPMSTIINAFSKLKREGEGVALQFVVSPASDTFIKNFNAVLDDVRKGLPARKPNEMFSVFDRQLVKHTKDLIFGISKDKEEEKKEPNQQDASLISEKIGSTIVNTNIRLIVSSESKERALEILKDIESSFNQFEKVSSNSISFKRISENNISEFEKEFSFRLWSDKNQVPLNLKELATLMHFPAGIKTAPQLKQSKAGTGPAPLDMEDDGILIGYNQHRDVVTPVHLKKEDRMRHFYVIGQTGTGKTSILKNMIAQDIANGDGCCYIDPHGSDIQDILSYVPRERMDDVIYFDPAYTPRPMGLNMLEFDPKYPEQKTFVINDMMLIFNQLFDMKVSGGAMFEQYFKNSALLVMEHPESGNTMLEITRVLQDKAFRDMKLSHCKNPIIRQFWAAAEETTGEQGLSNFVPYISSKFDPMISNEIMRPVVAQEHSSFNFRKIMDEKKILLVNLSKGRLGELNANLIGLILVGKIQMAALSRADMYGQKMNDFYLYIDEFQNVTTPAIASILSEARKYRLSLNVAHQYIAQLPDDIKNAVFGNVGSMGVFRVSPDDAEYLEPKFAPTFTANDITKLENRNAYMSMIINGAPSTKPFNIVTADNPEGDKSHIEEIKNMSYQKYGRDRAEVEAEIFAKYDRNSK